MEGKKGGEREREKGREGGQIKEDQESLEKEDEKKEAKRRGLGILTDLEIRLHLSYLAWFWNSTVTSQGLIRRQSNQKNFHCKYQKRSELSEVLFSKSGMRDAQILSLGKPSLTLYH